jgi:hypothetical protein
MARAFSNAANSALTLPSVNTLDQFSVLSVSAWIYTTVTLAASQFRAIIADGVGPGVRNFYIDYRNFSGFLGLELSNSVASVFGEYQVTTTLTTNTWYHVLFTALYGSPTVVNCYLNGVSQSVSASGATSGSPDASNFNRYIAGDSGNAASWDGRLADIAVWSAVLSQTEATGLARGLRPAAIRPQSLVAWWPLDGIQSPEPDLGGHALNGTLQNNPTLAFGPPFTMFTRRWLRYELFRPDFILMPQIVT